jgi:DNA-directed RNA polymerase beta' subunit
MYLLVSYSDCLIEDAATHSQMVAEKITAAAIGVNEIERKRELRRRKEKLKGKKENLLELEREEKEIISILNNTRNVGVRTAEKYLGPNNGFNISALSKVKGDNFNIAQIIDLVGQQFINSKRLPKAMTGGTRCSPYFAPGDTSIQSQGFCTGNFFEGLSPAEQFFLQTGSRENTVESTIKVPTSGDINHRMVKNFEDITLQNNGTVTNSRDRIFQFAYEDGFNSAEMTNIESRFGKSLSFMNFKIFADKLNVKYGYEVSNPKYESK